LGNLYIADTNNNAIRKVTAAGTITTVAGNGTPGYSGDNGPASAALLSGPHGILVDASGNLLIADTYNWSIRRVNAAGIITTIAGTGVFCPPNTSGSCGGRGDGGPATSAFLSEPGSVAVDTLGNLFIADTGDNSIRQVNSSGIINRVAGSGVNGYGGDHGPAGLAYLNQPNGVALDAAGNVFIADTLNHRIRKVDTSGIITTIAGNGVAGYTGDGGPASAASLNMPSYIVLDGAGNLYISDSANERIRETMVSGTIDTIAGDGGYRYAGDGGLATSASIQQPLGVAVDASGNLFIADTYNNCIREVDINGVISTVAGNGIPGYSGDTGPAVGASLDLPRTVAFDAAGNLFIADNGNNVVRRVTAGIISTIAGNGVAGYYGDNGPATSASLYSPSGVAIDNSGNVYIADEYNSAIRMVAPGGTITTIAGTGIASCDYGAIGPALGYPTGITLDGSGNLAVADNFCSTVWNLTAAGLSGRTQIAVSPEAIAVDASGNLFVGAPLSEVIQKLTTSGAITTVAGNGVSGYSGDNGPAVDAELYWPYGVAVDGACNLFIADSLNNRIRKVAGLAVSPASVFLDATSQSAPPLSITPVSSGCAWTSVSSAPWIDIISGSGSGKGTVTFSVQANSTGTQRIGTLTIGGQTVSVTQRETDTTFTDVSDPSAYYFDAANIMYQLGISNGCSTAPLMYCPADTNTRGQMAKFIVVALAGTSFTYNPTPYFSDVPASYPFFSYIQKLYELGITSGCQAAPPMFCPDDGVTRGQTAAFIIRSRYASIPFSVPSTPYFTDVPPSYPFFNYIQKMAELGITSGCTPTTYCPEDELLRDQMSVFIVRGLLNQLLPASTPIVTSVSPNSAPAGTPVTVTITGVGTHFAPGTSQVMTVAGISASNVVVNSPTSLTVQLLSAPGVTPNPSPIMVVTGSEEAGLPSGFTVQ